MIIGGIITLADLVSSCKYYRVGNEIGVDTG